ncbi:MAG: histidine triad nucleotide-binding protein [Endomicrobium sp.]|jgi:histidine triad (HIT) family protein|nr:histidine triad nucleotide-binding protein [Endomicrobium sp.]
MSENCLFCKIIAGEIPSSKVYEDDGIFAFKDINPQAPVHIVIVPKKHIASLGEALIADGEVLGALQIAASKIAKMFGETKQSFRVVNNCGADAGQTVFHIHYHLLGGRKFGWPPG